MCNSAMKKNGILMSVTTQKDPGSILLYEVSQRERQLLYYFTHIWNLKNKTINNK